MMAKSKNVERETRGLSATGENPVVTIRLPLELAQQIDAWAEANGEESRSHAMLRLLGTVLNVVPKRKGVAGGPLMGRSASNLPRQ
jgi:hypothetical protein